MKGFAVMEEVELLWLVRVESLLEELYSWKNLESLQLASFERCVRTYGGTAHQSGPINQK